MDYEHVSTLTSYIVYANIHISADGANILVIPNDFNVSKTWT